MNLSIVIPVYNEKGNLPALTEQLLDMIEKQGYDKWEIIYVDDGSKDGSYEVLKEQALKEKNIKVVRFLRNFGQTSALSAGINRASGDIIVLLDSDLENSPYDVPKLVDKIKDGYDVVSGWRKNRWEGQFLTRKLPSTIANFLISKISDIELHDFGCTLKAYRKTVLKQIKLYGEMHRFIPALAAWYGYKVCEVSVEYKQRVYGSSKYGLSRIFKVLLDILFLKFLFKFLHRPLHFFGGIGIFSFFVGGLAGLIALYFKLSTANHKDFIETPLPTIMTMFVLLGAVFVLMGILAELLIRVYFEGQKKDNFLIKEEINLDD